MRTVFQGKQVTVTVKTTGRDLTTQEIVAGFQLATGNFEALFVENEPGEKVDVNPAPCKTEESEIAWIEKGDWVDVEVSCPFCGHNGKTGTRWGNSFCKCSECGEKLFNKFATDKPGEKNSYGCVYVANEPMVFKGQIETDLDLFGV